MIKLIDVKTFVGALILAGGALASMNSYAWHGGWHGGGWHGGGWHGGGWHGGGWNHGWHGGGWRNAGWGYGGWGYRGWGYPGWGYGYGAGYVAPTVVYYGARRCAWIPAHRNARGYWIRGHRACWYR